LHICPVNVNINQEWKDIKEVIMLAVTEALSKREERNNTRELRIWNEEIKALIHDQKEAYL